MSGAQFSLFSSAQVRNFAAFSEGQTDSTVYTTYILYITELGVILRSHDVLCKRNELTPCGDAQNDSFLFILWVWLYGGLKEGFISSSYSD